ncbi:MAG: hypothetical protein PHU42_00635 [Patescibacteria group bacterium]|nr:hypothetical protein [Patescibacteria group bacterium]
MSNTAAKRRMNVVFNLGVNGTIFFNTEEDFFIRIERGFDTCNPDEKELYNFLAAHSIEQEQGRKNNQPTTTFDMEDTSYRPDSLLHLIDLLRMDGVGVKEA